MFNSSMLKKVAAAVLAALAGSTALAAPDASGVFFGKAASSPYTWATGYQDFGPQGRFFSTADYGFIPGGEYKLTGKEFGLNNHMVANALYTRGQNPVAGEAFARGATYLPWLSDGGKCVFGLTFEKPFETTWSKSVTGPGQFDRFKDKVPLFDQAVIQWGSMVPKKGSWGVCVLDAQGEFKRVKVDNQQEILPYGATTIALPPTTVKTLYVGLTGGEGSAKDNFAEVRSLVLNLYNEPMVDNRMTVWQMDAYQALYSAEKPGTLLGLKLANIYFGQYLNSASPDLCILTDLVPFVELGANRVFATKSDRPVQVESSGRTYTLNYTLKYSLPGGKEAEVKVKAIYGVGLKDTVSFACKASALPQGARLGFEMSARKRLFDNYLNDSSTGVVVPVDGIKSFSTPAGPLGLSLKGTDKAILNVKGGMLRFDLFADGDALQVGLSLPIGPYAGIQPDMLNYNWRPSLAKQGDDGVAPFKMEDLALLETVDFGSTEDPHEVFDVSNDPLILNWKKSGDKKLPGGFGHLNLVNDPEKGKVPLTTILGQKCRAMNSNETTYLRVNLKTRFNPQTPYLIVVEHAFDKERRSEFHCVPVDRSGQALAPDGSMWPNPCPFGGFDTGKAPYANKFIKESVFVFRPWFEASPETSMLSLLFSNVLQWNNLGNDKPEGLAIKKIWIYRANRMPELPDMASLAPKGSLRHVVYAAETTAPWYLQQFPKLYGYNTVIANHMAPASLLNGGKVDVSRPNRWTHPGSLQGQQWLFEEAQRQGVFVKMFLSSLLSLGWEDSDAAGAFMREGTYSGAGETSVPLSPTKAELALIAGALNKSLGALAPYKSLYSISISGAPQCFFTRRNLDDFSRETGIAFKSSPVVYENINKLLDSDQKTVDAWTKWSGQKRFEFLDWLLKQARKKRPDLYLLINHAWHFNWILAAYYGPESVHLKLDHAKLAARGINNPLDFMKFVCHDPKLYAGNDGFCFVMQGEETSLNSCNNYKWPSPYQSKWFAEIRDGFGGGLSIHAPQFDECPKPFVGWTCDYVKGSREFRRELVEALLYANAREFFVDTYWYDPFRGRVDDLRALAVPFQLLPFAKPEDYTGKLADSAKQAVIKKYGDRYGLMNAGNLPTDVTLTLPEGAKSVIDLSNGVRQELPVSPERTVTLHLEQWSLKTLEIK
ncbi:MAG: hypothetical protein WCS31_12535 [Verrucomicrobiae bacterium]